MIERSMFFIKPEGYEHRGEIVRRIEETGLAITGLKEVVMTEAIVTGLYSHVPSEVLPRLRAQMLGKTCVVGMVFGKNAIERLAEIVGEHSESARCAPTSIRFTLGNHGEGCVHLNCVHRPKTAEEALAHLKLFGYKV